MSAPSAAAGRPAQGGANAGQQLADGEGLGDVIVGAQIERGDLVFLLAAGGKHHDGHLAPLADFADHFQAVAIGQAEIEQHQIRLARGGLRDAFLGGDGFVKLIIFRGQRGAEEAADLGIVLDHQNEGLHGRFAFVSPAEGGCERWRRRLRDASASMVPRCACTMARQMARPSPAPRTPSDLPR